MHVRLVKIDRRSLSYHVKLAFDGDRELMDNYHISPGTLNHCVAHTMEFIEQNADHYKDDIEFYAVVYNVETVIGYTIIIRNATHPNELYSFGINVKYRQKDILMAWMDQVKEKIGEPFYIVLWSKNTRAINFFEKNGFLVQRTSKLLDDELKTLITCKELAL